MWTKPSWQYQRNFGFVRKTNAYLDDSQNRKFQHALVIENQLYNFALHYLNKRYGYKHIDRKVPKKVAKYTLATKIKSLFLNEKFGLSRWSVKKLGLSSHNAQAFVVQLITNFLVYKKQLRKNFYNMTDKDKYNFKMNIQKTKKGKHTNPKRKSWYRIGALGFNANNRTILIDLQKRCGLTVISMHKIVIPDYGLLHIQGNAYELCESNEIKQVKLKYQRNHTYQLQLVHVRKKPKFDLQGKSSAGLDWNMYHYQYLQDSDGDKPLKISKEVVTRVDEYEKKINRLKSKRDLGKGDKQLLNHQIRRCYAKRSQLLTEFYRNDIPKIVDKYQVLVIEGLQSKDMRHNGHGRGCDRGFNRKLALLKPYELGSIIANYAFKHGKLVVKVDPYKTSQVEFGTEYVTKHPLDERMFESQAHPGKMIGRDENAAKNIKKWGLHPDQHYKVKKFPKVTPRMVADYY